MNRAFSAVRGERIGYRLVWDYNRDVISTCLEQLSNTMQYRVNGSISTRHNAVDLAAFIQKEDLEDAVTHEITLTLGDLNVKVSNAKALAEHLQYGREGILFNRISDWLMNERDICPQNDDKNTRLSVALQNIIFPYYIKMAFEKTKKREDDYFRVYSLSTFVTIDVDNARMNDIVVDETFYISDCRQEQLDAPLQIIYPNEHFLASNPTEEDVCAESIVTSEETLYDPEDIPLTMDLGSFDNVQFSCDSPDSNDGFLINQLSEINEGIDLDVTSEISECENSVTSD